MLHGKTTVLPVGIVMFTSFPKSEDTANRKPHYCPKQVVKFGTIRGDERYNGIIIIISFYYIFVCTYKWPDDYGCLQCAFKTNSKIGKKDKLELACGTSERLYFMRSK